jgi:thiamine-monophosphate kinase
MCCSVLSTRSQWGGTTCDQSVGILRIQDIGEQGLLKRLQVFCPPDVVGDDAAVLTVQAGKVLVVTSDVLVDGVHFSDRTTSPEDVGWRAAAANLSDVAAMGALPLGITVGLGLPGKTPVDWVERLYKGMSACLHQYHTAIVGGDVVRSPTITVAITAFGEVAPDRILRRSTAQVGDAIVVTGYHGASRAGLELLLHPELGQCLSTMARSTLIAAHQRPVPRLDLFTSQFPFPISRMAGMDSSDGLADAVIQICRESQCGARIDRSHLPIPPAFAEWISTEQALNWTLYGGEDFELVLCLPPAIASELVSQIGNGAAVIGTITADSAIWLVDSTGQYPDQPLLLEQGFQHFQTKS